RVDYLLFREKLRQQLHALQEAAAQYRQLGSWFPFAEKLYAIERLRRRGTEQNAQQLSATFHEMVLEINEKAKALEQQQDIDINGVLRAEGIVKGLQSALQSVHKFYNGYDPLYTWWAAAACEELDSALHLYARVWKQHEQTAPGSRRDSSGII